MSASVLSRLASSQNRRDEAPNQALARELAERQDRAAISELAVHLANADPAVQSDCIKVLYEVSYLRPELVAPYVEDFLKLLASRNNRLVWGGMIALAEVAALRADTLFSRRDELARALQSGSVITVDNAVKALAQVAAASPQYNAALFPVLLRHLESCRPKDLPQHAEKTLPAVNAQNRQDFVAVLEKRLGALTPAQAARVTRLLRRAAGDVNRASGA